MTPRQARGSGRLLVGGDVIDGTGAPRFAADVLVEDGRITAILRPGEQPSRPLDHVERLDVSGHVVTPGFIDMHAHSDLAVLADPDHSAKVAQGVTLEVVGQDGLGYAPVTDEVMAAVRRQIVGWNGDPGLDHSWRSVADYLDRVDQASPVNVATLVPHGTVRMIVMGTDARAATADELAQIRNIIAQGLAEGAVGLSTGLTYTPGMYASDAEIVDALEPVSRIGGYYCPHHRNYGSDLFAAYQACLDIAEQAGVPLHLAHCHVNHPQNAGRAGELVEQLDRAAERGVDITLDAYPYLAGATYLAALLPSWTQIDGVDGVLRRLADPIERRRILDEIELSGSDGNHGVPVVWDTIVVSSVQLSQNQWAVGESIATLAQRRATDPGELFAELVLADEAGSGCVVQVGNEDNVRTIMRHWAHTVGTDGILVGERPHPRGWGTFPRLLGTYVRELGVLTLEEAVEHATGRAARRLGLVDRGLVAVGQWADLVVLEPATVGSPATYAAPRLAPTGIRDVLVNGVLVLRAGTRTAARPGKAVRRT